MKRLLSLISAALVLITLAPLTIAQNKPPATQPAKSNAAAAGAKVEKKTEAKGTSKHHAGKKAEHGKKKQESRA
jgi:hypothetical protein